MIRINILFFFLLFLFSVYGKEVILIQTTDLHGNLTGDSSKPGICKVATRIKEIRACHGEDNVLLFDCGDLIQGTSSAAKDRGAAIVSALNELKYDFWVLGNHEFDYGIDVLRERIREFRGLVLTSNIEFEEPLPNVRKWAIFERNGKRIGVIGMSPPFLRSWIAPAQLKGIREIPFEEALFTSVTALFREKVDVVILAIHLGEFITARLSPTGKRMNIVSFLRKNPQIRVVFGAHTHITVPLKTLNGTTFYVQPPALSEGLAEVKITFPGKNRDVEIEGRLWPTYNCDPDPELMKKLEFARENCKKEQRTVIAEVPFALGPMKGPKRRCHLAELLCKSMREELGVDAAFSTTVSNYHFPGGRLTEYGVFLLVPYENFLTILDLSPEDYRGILNEQKQLRQKKSFMVHTGVEEKDGVLYVNGQAWTDPEKRIRVAFSSYAVSGAGGRYPVLRDTANRVKREEKDLTVREVFDRWMRKHYPPKRGK